MGHHKSIRELITVGIFVIHFLILLSQLALTSELRPTASHWLLSYLCHRGQLARVYTEATHGLETKVGVPKDKIVFTHVRPSSSD